MQTSKRSLGIHLLAVVGAIVLAATTVSLANPSFSLETKSDWEAALDDGRISPVSSFYPALQAHYGTPGTDFIQVTPATPTGGLLALNNTESGGLGDGLLMYWGNPGSDLKQVSTWQYTYPLDPDLRNTVLNFNVHPWPGIQSVSLTLNDAALGWISWDWNVTAFPGAGPLYTGLMNPVSIRPDVFNAQGASSFAMAPGGFNPAIATTLQADELAVGANQWNVNFPVVPIVGGIMPWNYWGPLSITTIPEASTLVLLGCGLAWLVGFRHKASSRKG